MDSIESKIIFRIRLWNILRQIDTKLIANTRQKYAGTDWYDSKHWNVRSRVALALGHAYGLNLHRTKNHRVLDIGTGCGYFPFVCKQLGHSATGYDMFVPMYKDVVDILEVQWQEAEIRAFQELPKPTERYDLVTAILVFFDQHHTENTWGTAEWTFFLDDLATNQLSDCGIIYLNLVSTQKTEYSIDPDLGQLFHYYGAEISGTSVKTTAHSVRNVRLIKDNSCPSMLAT